MNILTSLTSYQLPLFMPKFFIILQPTSHNQLFFFTQQIIKIHVQEKEQNSQTRKVHWDIRYNFGSIHHSLSSIHAYSPRPTLGLDRWTASGDNILTHNSKCPNWGYPLNRSSCFSTEWLFALCRITWIPSKDTYEPCCLSSNLHCSNLLTTPHSYSYQKKLTISLQS